MWIELKCELCFDNNCLDLPSLTKIKGNRWIHSDVGFMIIHSMIWLDLIRLDLIWLDHPLFIEIQQNGCCIHEHMGHVILESMIWFDLIN